MEVEYLVGSNIQTIWYDVVNQSCGVNGKYIFILIVGKNIVFTTNSDEKVY
jgi:hypothetical protein